MSVDLDVVDRVLNLLSEYRALPSDDPARAVTLAAIEGLVYPVVVVDHMHGVFDAFTGELRSPPDSASPPPARAVREAS